MPYIPVAIVRELSYSPRANDRKKAVRVMRQQILCGKPTSYLPIARRLIADKNNNVHWQATIVVGEFIATQPSAVWNTVLKHAAMADDDMKTALACVLLEHLLEHEFDTFFSKIKREVISGNRDMADILSRCWRLGTSRREWLQVERVLRLSSANHST